MLLGGGTQHNLTRLIGKCHLHDVTFDYVTSDDPPAVWTRKGRKADVAIVRTGWVSHKVWHNLKGVCKWVVPIAQNGEEAMLDAIHDAYKRKNADTLWTKMIGWF